MKFSEAWLREWVNPDIDREALLAQLTMAGLEVDGVDPVAESFSEVVVGRIEACEAHPDADKLKVCRVSDGTEEFQVVCGAPNAREGLLTCFAKVGAQLGEDFKIKKAKLRGVESHGMLCSAKELGLGEDHDGIMELPADAPVGSLVREYLTTDDVIVDLDLTPNRGDCLSLKGIAREVGVLNNASVTYPVVEAVAPVNDASFAVELGDPDGCPRYLGRVIRGIDITRATPFWMQERLRRCGLRSIDPVVDVTNYVLIEMGQPMHAFDLNQLHDKIVVRRASQGEKLTLLDGQEVDLDEDTLLITDGDGPVAMAGVMGGQRSGVQADTKDVFLEVAFFAPLAIAGTARKYGLHTDASHRYERGVDHQLQAEAMERATGLLLDIVGGEPGPVVESVSTEHLPPATEVTLRHARLTELLGVEISSSQVTEALTRLHLPITATTDDSWTIAVPSHRFDIAIEADLVEEVCRVYGYNNIPVKAANASLQLRKVEVEKHAELELKNHLAQGGFQEVITYTFIDPVLQDLLAPGDTARALANPMSSEQSVMRTNLMPGLVGALQGNVARQQDRVRLFEVGLVFRDDGGALSQPQVVGGLLWGRRVAESWLDDGEQTDFFDAKGVVDGMLAWAGLSDVTYAPCTDPQFHPGQSAIVSAGADVIGRVGRLHPEVESRLETEGVFVFELNAAKVLAAPRRTHGEISRFPSVRRDLAIVVDRSVTAEAVESTVRKTLGEILVEFTLFDVYAGKGIDSNEKSLAVGLTLQSQTATLTEEEISGYSAQVVSALQADLGGRLR